MGRVENPELTRLLLPRDKAESLILKISEPMKERIPHAAVRDSLGRSLPPQPC